MEMLSGELCPAGAGGIWLLRIPATLSGRLAFRRLILSLFLPEAKETFASLGWECLGTQLDNASGENPSHRVSGVNPQLSRSDM